MSDSPMKTPATNRGRAAPIAALALILSAGCMGYGSDSSDQAPIGNMVWIDQATYRLSSTVTTDTGQSSPSFEHIIARSTHIDVRNETGQREMVPAILVEGPDSDALSHFALFDAHTGCLRGVASQSKANPPGEDPQHRSRYMDYFLGDQELFSSLLDLRHLPGLIGLGLVIGAQLAVGESGDLSGIAPGLHWESPRQGVATIQIKAPDDRPWMTRWNITFEYALQLYGSVPSSIEWDSATDIHLEGFGTRTVAGRLDLEDLQQGTEPRLSACAGTNSWLHPRLATKLLGEDYLPIADRIPERYPMGNAWEDLEQVKLLSMEYRDFMDTYPGARIAEVSSLAYDRTIAPGSPNDSPIHYVDWRVKIQEPGAGHVLEVTLQREFPSPATDVSRFTYSTRQDNFTKRLPDESPLAAMILVPLSDVLDDLEAHGLKANRAGWKESQGYGIPPAWDVANYENSFASDSANSARWHFTVDARTGWLVRASVTIDDDGNIIDPRPGH